VSLAGSWAMRPQTAMAALFLVMIGTSLLLLRGKSSRAPPSEDVTVTERGAPASEPVPASLPSSFKDRGTAFSGTPGSIAPSVEPKAASPSPAGALATAPGPGGSLAGPTPVAAPPLAEEAVARTRAELSPLDAALEAYRAGRFDDAARSFEALAASDPNADLWAARSLRESKGCRNAVARFDKVARRASGTAPGWDALLEGALCYRAIGDFGKARVYLTALLAVDSHKDRARTELDRIGGPPYEGSRR
jgi:TolA-binding protein